jgi:hypothetical protein
MKKYWLGLIILTFSGVVFIIKDSLYMTEKIYVIYNKDNRFYKNKFEEIFYYKKKDEVLELVSFENTRKVQIKHDKLNKLNIISIDSLSEMLPLNFYKKDLLGEKEVDRLRKMKIFLIDIDSIKHRIYVQEVHQSFTEYE